MATQVSGVSQWLTLNGAPVRFGHREENLDARAVENHNNHFVVTTYAPPNLTLRIDDIELETEVYGRWLWQARDYAGVYTLTVKTSDGRTAQTQIRVTPSKLSQERYDTMLEDISRISSELVFALHAPAHANATLRRGLKSPSISDYRRLQVFMRSLEDSLARIAQSPHTRLGIHTEVRSLHEMAGHVGNVQPVPGESEYIGFGSTHRQHVPLVPRYWVTERSEPTYDVPENRLVKQFLWRQLLPRIQQIAERAETEVARRKSERQHKLRNEWEDDETPKIVVLERIIEDCERLARRTVVMGSLPFLRDVDWPAGIVQPTQVLQKHPHYSRFYRLYLQFQTKLKYTTDSERYVAQVATRKVAELYELWSVFTMTSLIMDILRKAGFSVVSSQRFYRIIDDQLQVEVDRDATIELRQKRKRVLIRYEPLYPPEQTAAWGLVSTTRSQLTPDLAIEHWEGDQPHKVIVFDAKYRINRQGGRETFWDDDLDKMDLYLNRIRWKPQNPRMRPRPVVSSAYIVFPGDDIDHDSEYPDVGALPLKPKMKQVIDLGKAMLDLLKTADLV